MAYLVIANLPVPGDNILCDDLIVLSTQAVAKDYSEVLRRITALVEVDGVEQEMVFLTNNMEWSLASVADLYRSRWSIEAFFKQIKQTLQLANFLGHSANAVRWQIWSALLVYVPAIPRLRSWMASQLYPNFHFDPQCPVASMGFDQPAAILWDSIRCLPVHSQPATALFQWFLNIPVGQPHT
jgi:hypothetical protein